jgi:hypothetical protein
MWFEHLTATLLNRVLPAKRAPRVPGVLLGLRSDSNEPVVWPDRYRREHCVCIGKTGTGKTYMLERLAWQLAAAGEGFALFDFHGDVSMSLSRRLLSLPHAAERVILLDPSHPTRSPGLNILDSGPTDAERFRKVAELSSILRQRWSVESFGARTEELLRNSLYVLATTGHTLADLPRLLTDVVFRRAVNDAIDHPDIRSYWADRYEPLSEPMKGAFREPLLNRVTGFLTEPAARHLLSQPSTINVAEVMATQQWLIIRLPKGRLRDHAHTLGNLLFAQLQFAALAREGTTRAKRHTFTLICDEAQNLAENDLTVLLAEGRKFGISVITANQFWAQIPQELRGALLSAASQIVFRVSSTDGQLLAHELNPERKSRVAIELTDLARGEAVAKFGTAPAVRFRTQSMPSVRPLTEAELEPLISSRTRLRSEIEKELRLRRSPRAAANSSSMPSANQTPEGQHGW